MSVRVFGGPLLQRVAAAARGSVLGGVETASPALATSALQPTGQARAFSAPMFRVRPSPSPWMRQAGRSQTLTNSSSAMAAAAAWTASVLQQEFHLVEDWLQALHSVDEEARSVCQGLLSRHPEVLHRDPTRVASTVQALVDSLRARNLLKPYFIHDASILALVDRYTPEGLRARLNELHRLVWNRLDDVNVSALFATRSSLDMLDLEARSLAQKAEWLHALIPEFLPSTVLRACPELLDVPLEDLAHHVLRAGNVVVIGPHVSAEHVPDSDAVVVRSRTPVAGASSSPTAAAAPSVATAGRLLRTARCGAQQALRDLQAPAFDSDTAVREEVRVVSNTRTLVYAGPGGVEVRVEDPAKAQEDLSAGLQVVLQSITPAQQQVHATAGMRRA